MSTRAASGWPLAVSITATILLLGLAGRGLAQAGAREEPPYLALGLAAAEARPGGAVRLVLDIANAQGRPLTARLTVTSDAPIAGEGGAGGLQTLWDGSLEAPSDRDGHAVVEVAGGCGRRLTMTLDADGVVRSLAVLVPCVAAAP